ncbi:MAG: hypothetical protein WD939_03540 [Dehalococcoidia bacterium]
MLLLLAFLPSFLYVGHWTDMVNVAFGQPGATEAAASSAHEAHCHFGQSTCSDQPVPAEVKVAPTVVEVPKLELTSDALEDSDTILIERFVAPPTEPPRL